jgi:phosphate ABC transporter permease protein PstC
VEASATTAPGGRSVLERSPLGRLPDKVLQWGLTLLAVLILVLLAYFFVRLIGESTTALNKFGLSFITGNDWDVSRNIYHGAALVVGTLITSAIALLIGVPVAVGTALFLTEMCPRRARGPLSVLVDLLAAVPSVVYGLWGVFVLGPKLIPVERWFANTFSFIPWIGGGGSSITPGNYFIAGLILAIMILPIVSAISREVLATVPSENKEAALALGATRWEMIRMAVLPYARPGITGGAMLGLGRAIGETIAVVLVIGNAPTIGHHLFSQGYTLAAVIANEFGEAANTPIHASSLFAAGLVLFVLTLLINIIARWWIARGNRKLRGGAAGGPEAHDGEDVVVAVSGATLDVGKAGA